MPAADISQPLLMILGVVLFIFGLMVMALFNRWTRRQRGNMARRGGARAEVEAQRLLRAEGFEILAEEPQLDSRLMINGDPASFSITPDLMVARDGVTYIVEIKRDTAGIRNAGVRRQVLEYLYAGGHPVLLVIMPEGELDLIELPPEH